MEAKAEKEVHPQGLWLRASVAWLSLKAEAED